MTINLMNPLFLVDAGPCPGAYFSREAYEDHLKRQGIQHPLETFGVLEPLKVGEELMSGSYNPGPYEDGVRPVEAKLCTEEEARNKFSEFFERFERGGGANLRVELVRSINGLRFVLVCDWDDMG